jgi:hypothetical protein
MGDAIWKDAEKAKITSRSWQSMKNRFKVLEPTIASCSFLILVRESGFDQRDKQGLRMHFFLTSPPQ